MFDPQAELADTYLMTDEQSRFLQEQSVLMGEPLGLMTYGRLLLGPMGFPSLVYLLIGPSALHVASAISPLTVFGFASPGKPPKPWPPVSFPRAEVSFTIPNPTGFWSKLTAPGDVIDIDTQVARLHVQLFGNAKGFAVSWTNYWNEGG